MKLPFTNPRTEFVLTKLLKEDSSGLDGRQLTPELREHFTDLLREHYEAKQRERGR